MLGGPAMDKHSSLLQKLVNYGYKMLYNIEPRLDKHARDHHSNLLGQFVSYGEKGVQHWPIDKLYLPL
jgi:hypothetical protein